MSGMLIDKFTITRQSCTYVADLGERARRLVVVHQELLHDGELLARDDGEQGGANEGVD